MSMLTHVPTQKLKTAAEPPTVRPSDMWARSRRVLYSEFALPKLERVHGLFSTIPTVATQPGALTMTQHLSAPPAGAIVASTRTRNSKPNVVPIA